MDFVLQPRIQIAINEVVQDIKGKSSFNTKVLMTVFWDYKEMILILLFQSIFRLTEPDQILKGQVASSITSAMFWLTWDRNCYFAPHIDLIYEGCPLYFGIGQP